MELWEIMPDALKRKVFVSGLILDFTHQRASQTLARGNVTLKT